MSKIEELLTKDQLIESFLPVYISEIKQLFRENNNVVVKILSYTADSRLIADILIDDKHFVYCSLKSDNEISAEA